jgi:hypothetical protein
MYPTAAVMTEAFATHLKFRKRGLQEMDHSLDITYGEVRMFKPNSHCTPPMRLISLFRPTWKKPVQVGQRTVSASVARLYPATYQISRRAAPGHQSFKWRALLLFPGAIIPAACVASGLIKPQETRRVVVKDIALLRLG